MRALLLLCLLASFTAIGYYFGRSSVQKAFIPPPVRTDATEERARRTEPRLPDPPQVQTTGGPPPESPAPVRNTAVADLRISLPVANLQPKDILDTFDQARSAGERRHEATDIMAPRGTPVLAVDDGVIKKLFTSKPGGLTIYQYDPSQRYCYYYAHLDRYAQGLREGDQVQRGQLIGYVGSTGNADPSAPHLHFAVLELGPSKEWWHDTVPVNPYPLLMGAFDRR